MVLKSRNSKDGVPYTVMECFAGIGAQHMALHTSGETGPQIPYEIVGTAEIDPRSIAAYNAIHAGDGGYTPDRNIGDVTTHHLPNCDIVTYSFPCLVGNTFIRTIHGNIPIRDVVAGESVLGHDGAWHKVVESARTGHKKVCACKPMCGEEILCTPDHRFYARKKGRVWNNDRRSYDRTFDEPQWVSAEDLDGYYVGFPVPSETGIPDWHGIDQEWSDGRASRHVNDLSELMGDTRFWWTVGRYIADGWTRTQGGIVIAIGKGKEADESKLAPIPHNKVQEGPVTKVHIPRQELQAFCEQFGVGAENKHIPEKYLGLPIELSKALLEGYLSGDGYRRKNGTIRAVTISRQLAYDLARLVAYVYHRPCRIYLRNVSPIKEIEGRSIHQHNYYEIEFKTVPSKGDEAFYEDGWIWTPIKYLGEHGEEDVYDLEVEGAHSFVANGIVVHNCQGLSKANTGKKKGLTDPESHSSVLWALEDEIRRTRPKWLVMENVTQIHNRNYMPDFQRWIDVLSEMGYTSKWGDLRVSDFGVPQDRDRCFMISHLGPGCPDLPTGDAQAPRLLDFIDDDPALLADYEIPYAMLCDLMHGG